MFRPHSQHYVCFRHLLHVRYDARIPYDGGGQVKWPRFDVTSNTPHRAFLLVVKEGSGQGMCE